MRLSEVAGISAALVKIDVDGLDAKIINAALDFLADVMPVLIFEVQIRARADLESVDAVMTNLKAIGYNHFIVWDDPGRHMLSSSDIEAVADLNRYLLRGAPIPNYDVACFADRDVDVFGLVTRCYRSGELRPK